MKRFMNWAVLAVLVVPLIAASAHAVSVQRFTNGATEIYELDDSGNVEIAGTLSVTGAVTNSGTVSLYSRTITQINSLAPTAVGQLLYCSDCVRSAICVSSGTAAGAWVVAVSTATTPAYNTLHCQ